MQTVESSLDIQKRAHNLFSEHQKAILQRTDRLFAVLMIVQWLAAIAAAFFISPKTWEGTDSQTHIHVFSAIFLGGLITFFPVSLAIWRPGSVLTRHSIAVGQMLFSALLIQISGGRIETHFHVFGSLAFLAFYRDWRVLITASFIVGVDHFLRGVFWPQSVYGILVASQWRWLEHVGWVLFEDIFLMKSCLQGVEEMHEIAERQAKLEAINEDIEKKVLERTAELKESEDRFERLHRQKESILNSIGEGILEVDLQGRAVFVNRVAASMFAVNVKDLIGRTLNSHIAAGKLETMLQSTSEVSVESFHRKDGTTFPVEYCSTPNLNKHRKRVGSVIVFRDITERLRAERDQENQKQLQVQKVEALGRLAGGIAHDFNNNLMAIGGYCELLLMQLNQQDHLRSNVIGIQKAAEQGTYLTRQLLAFSRKQVLEPKLLNLNHVIQNTESMLQRVIREDIDLRISLDENLGSVMADPGQLEQVIVNLVVNARDAIPQRGRIAIETSNLTLTEKLTENPDANPGEYVLLTVSDTGIGMDERTKRHIFEPFFTTKEKGKGTGLGLSTVYGIVKQSGGSIWASGEMGNGTVFKLLFPRIDQKAEPVSESVNKISSVRAWQTILLVDDNQAVRESFASLLRTRGFKVLLAGDGKDALDKFQNNREQIHLLITDMIMPVMSGLELAEALLSKSPATKVLFMSGYSEEAVQHQGMLVPGSAFISKPVSSQFLLQKIDELVGDSGIIRVVRSKLA